MSYFYGGIVLDERKCEALYYEEDGVEISLLDVLLIIFENKKLILMVFFIFLFAGLGYGIFIKKPEFSSSMQIAAITQYSTKAGDFNVYVSGGLISGILTSDSVLDSVIDSNGLLKNDDGTVRTRVQARKSLSESIKPHVASSGIVTVTVEEKSPEKALEVAESLYDSSLVILQEMGMAISGQKDAYIQSEIEKNIEKIDEFKKQAVNRIIDKDIDQLLKTLSLFTLYEEGSVYRKSAPMVVQLVSPPSLPDQPLPGGRAKIAVLSAMLGLFLGLTLAFIRHFWRVSALDPETEEKVKRIKELAGIKKKTTD